MNDNNKSEPVTKADLKELEQKLSSRIGSLEKKTDSVEQKLGLKIGSVETRVARLEDVTQNIAIDLAKTQADVREIKHDMATKVATKDDISRIMSAIDAYTAETISHRNRDTLRGGKIMEHETKLSNHETRISELETNPR